MAEIKPTTTAKKNPFVLLLAIALVIAVAAAAVGFAGKNEALKQGEQLAAQVQTLPERIAELESKAEQNTATLESKTAELTSAQADLEAANSAKSALETQVSELANANTEVSEKLAATEAALTAVQSELEGLVSAKADLETQVSDLTAANATLQDAISAAAVSKAEADVRIAELTATKTDLEDQVVSLEQQLSTALLSKTFPRLQTALVGRVYADGTPFGRNAKGEPLFWSLTISFNTPKSPRDKDIAVSWGAMEMGEDWDAAKQGKTYFLVNKWGSDAYEYCIYLPDDPSLEGPQSVTIQKDGCIATIAFELSYMGDYTNGLGWQLKNVTTSAVKAEGK